MSVIDDEHNEGSPAACTEADAVDRRRPVAGRLFEFRNLKVNHVVPQAKGGTDQVRA